MVEPIKFIWIEFDLFIYRYIYENKYLFFMRFFISIIAEP